MEDQRARRMMIAMGKRGKRTASHTFRARRASRAGSVVARLITADGEERSRCLRAACSLLRGRVAAGAVLPPTRVYAALLTLDCVSALRARRNPAERSRNYFTASIESIHTYIIQTTSSRIYLKINFILPCRESCCV